MNRRRRYCALLLFAMLPASGVWGCGDDSATTGGGGSGAEGSGAGPATSGSTKQGTGGNNQGGDNQGGDNQGGNNEGGGGGTPGDSGHAATELVSAGEVCESQSYRLVYTLGQSSAAQQTMTSTSYRMQGGFVGATGSLQ